MSKVISEAPAVELSDAPIHRRVEPSVPLLSSKFAYRNSANTDVAATWAKWRAEHAKPMDGDQYQRDAIAEHESSLIPLLTASIEDARAKRAAKKR